MINPDANRLHLCFLAEDEPVIEPGKDDDDDPINPLVDALFDEVESLRLQVSVIICM